jgi:hypothetical protein
MTYKKVGGLHFWTIGRLGGSIYWKKAKAKAKAAQPTPREVGLPIGLDRQAAARVAIRSARIVNKERVEYGQRVPCAFEASAAYRFADEEAASVFRTVYSQMVTVY